MGKKNKFKNKQEQVAHVSKESGIDPKELDRMDTEAIDKIDDLVHSSDDDLLGGGDSSTVHERNEAGETDVGAGVHEDGSDIHGDGTVDASGVEQGGVSDVDQRGSSAGLPSAVVVEEEVQIPPSETPHETSEVETGQGQGSTTDVLPSGENTDDVVKPHEFIGYHPATGEKVYADEQ